MTAGNLPRFEASLFLTLDRVTIRKGFTMNEPGPKQDNPSGQPDVGKPGQSGQPNPGGKGNPAGGPGATPKPTK